MKQIQFPPDTRLTKKLFFLFFSRRLILTRHPKKMSVPIGAKKESRPQPERRISIKKLKRRKQMKRVSLLPPNPGEDVPPSLNLRAPPRKVPKWVNPPDEDAKGRPRLQKLRAHWRPAMPGHQSSKRPQRKRHQHRGRLTCRGKGWLVWPPWGRGGGGVHQSRSKATSPHPFKSHSGPF